MSKMPVSNSSPLIHMSRLGKLGYAKDVFPSVIIPPAVRRETIGEGKEEGYADALNLERFEKEGWLSTTVLSRESKNLAEELEGTLGQGEAEALALALEKKDRLFMDDLKGRRTAELYGVETITTLGLILELLANGALDLAEYERNVKEYGSQGWIGGDVVQRFLEKGREIGR